MGQDVLCHGCGKPLAIEDFTMGAAQAVGNRTYCRPCMPASEVKTILSPTPPPEVAAPPPKGSLPLVLGAVGVAILAVAAAVVMLRPPKSASTVQDPGRSASAPSLQNELQALKGRVDASVSAEHFGEAISVLREARKTHDVPEWIGSVDQRIRELQQTVDGLHAQLVEEAVEARKRGGQAEVEKIRQRIAQWAMPLYSSALEQALGAVRLPEPVPGFGLRLIPGLGEAGRIHRRYGNTAATGVEAVPFGVGRSVGFEGELFQSPTDGDVQVTLVTPTAQTFTIRLIVAGERGRMVPYEYTHRNASAGTPVQIRAAFNRFTEGGRTLAAGSIVKQLHVIGQDSKVAFRVTELTVVKRRD